MYSREPASTGAGADSEHGSSMQIDRDHSDQRAESIKDTGGTGAHLLHGRGGEAPQPYL
jgi:hypothetical protein